MSSMENQVGGPLSVPVKLLLYVVGTEYEGEMPNPASLAGPL